MNHPRLPRVDTRRVYEPPREGERARALVERLWPRGVSKEKLNLDLWAKDAAPSPELRTWFGHDVERWDEFCRRYTSELDANEAAWRPLLDLARERGGVTLLYAKRDTEHNSALVLRQYLEERLAARR